MRSAHWTLICLVIVMLLLSRVPASMPGTRTSETLIGSLQSRPATLADLSLSYYGNSALPEVSRPS